MRSLVLPSCRKNALCPSPHKGAVRNSSGPAAPCVTWSESLSPMWWTARSEKRLACCWLSAAMGERPVVNEGVWQDAHPIRLNSFLPLSMDAEHGGSGDVPHAGVG